MSFVCSLDKDVELDIDLIESNNEFTARVAVGFDRVRAQTYSIAVALSPLPGASMELTFSIVSYCQISGEMNALWDGLATKSIFSSKNDRELIRAAFMTCVKLLIDLARPEIVSFVTHTDNLPEKALGKFFEVQRLFREHGYVGGRADPYHGRNVWMMRREDTI